MAKANIDSLLSAVAADDLRKFVKLYSKEHPEMVEALKIFIVTYQDLAWRIGRIKHVCPAGKLLAEKAVAFYLNEYPKRPALREELEKI